MAVHFMGGRLAVEDHVRDDEENKNRGTCGRRKEHVGVTHVGVGAWDWKTWGAPNNGDHDFHSCVSIRLCQCHADTPPSPISCLILSPHKLRFTILMLYSIHLLYIIIIY